LFPVKITGGVPVPEYPGADRECPALPVRYEIKKADRKRSYTAPCGAIRQVRMQKSAEAIVAKRRE
jgi:hypothetical protein